MTTLPAMPDSNWAETKDTLHLFLQIIGKVHVNAHTKLNHYYR